MRTSDDELAAGGQGRTAQDVKASAEICAECAALAMIVLVVAALVCLAGCGVRPWYGF
jgi:hypothetical protein